MIHKMTSILVLFSICFGQVGSAHGRRVVRGVMNLLDPNAAQYSEVTGASWREYRDVAGVKFSFNQKDQITGIWFQRSDLNQVWMRVPSSSKQELASATQNFYDKMRALRKIVDEVEWRFRIQSLPSGQTRLVSPPKILKKFKKAALLSELFVKSQWYLLARSLHNEEDFLQLNNKITRAKTAVIFKSLTLGAEIERAQKLLKSLANPDALAAYQEKARLALDSPEKIAVAGVLPVSVVGLGVLLASTFWSPSREVHHPNTHAENALEKIEKDLNTAEERSASEREE